MMFPSCSGSLSEPIDALESGHGGGGTDMTTGQAIDPVSHRRHFAGLDGLRGIAAISVVVAHSLYALGVRQLGNYGLAVDFFFALSGFVVAHAYEPRLRSGSMSPLAFILLRVRRLHPLVLLAAAIGLGTYALLAAHGLLPRDTIGGALRAGLFAALCLPFGRLPGSGLAFPLNSPQWSLFDEYGVNIVYGLIARRLSLRLLVAVLVLGLVMLAALVYRQGSIYTGWSTSNWPGGLGRVIAPFFIGVLLARLHSSGHLPRWSMPWILQALILLAILWLPPVAPGLTGLASVVLLFPVLLISGRNDRFSAPVGRFATYIGQLSYPLYILHYPVVCAIALLRPPADMPALLLMLSCQIGAALLLGHLALKLYDEPIRRRLARRARR